MYPLPLKLLIWGQSKSRYKGRKRVFIHLSARDQSGQGNLTKLYNVWDERTSYIQEDPLLFWKEPQGHTAAAKSRMPLWGLFILTLAAPPIH